MGLTSMPDEIKLWPTPILRYRGSNSSSSSSSIKKVVVVVAVLVAVL